MATCDTCGKKFHACSSCDFDYRWEWDYCCEGCFMQSKFYKDSDCNKAVIKRYLEENPELLEAFIKLRENPEIDDETWVEDIYYSLKEQ